MKSRIFYTKTYKLIEDKIKKFLNNYPPFLTKDTIESPRAVGDALQHILENNFQHIIGNYAKDTSADFPRRAMADIAFTDHNGIHYIIDVKTHRLDTKFNMPNLTSVERITRFYEDDNNYYIVLIISYNKISSVKIKVDNVHFVPIEFLSWECLTIGALGWGQIQIANANNIIINHGYSRKVWMLDLCNALLDFYPKEINKISKRLDYFKKIKNNWSNRKDIWK